MYLKPATPSDKFDSLNIEPDKSAPHRIFNIGYGKPMS